MKAKEYQNLAMRTNDGKGTDRLEEWIREETGAEYKGDVMIENEIDAGGLLNGCLGLSGEAGELNDLVKKRIFQMNIDKLKARYPEGFSERRANNRSEDDI